MHSSRVQAGVGVDISKAPTEGTLIFFHTNNQLESNHFIKDPDGH